MPNQQTNTEIQDILSRQRRSAEAITKMVLSRPANPVESATESLPDDRGVWPGIPTLADIRVKSFTVTPSAIRPKSGGTEIRWSVDIPSGLAAVIMLNDVPVPPSGSIHEDPVASKFYWLSAYRSGAVRFLDARILSVDNTGCIEEKPLELSLVQKLAAHTAYVTKGFKDGVAFEVSGVTAVATMESEDDLTVTEDGGLVLFTLKASMTLAGFHGGKLRSKVWLRLHPHDGSLAHLVDHSDTSHDLPPGIWALAILGGPTWWAATAALQELIRQKMDPLFRAAIDGGFSFDAFFHNVISVEVQPETPDHEAWILAQVRKAACL